MILVPYLSPRIDEHVKASVRIIDYAGNSANNRQIVLGGIYDQALVVSRTEGTVSMLVWAIAILDHYAIFQSNATPVFGYLPEALGAAMWQGFVADRRKVQLGSSGGYPQGTNFTGKSYRLVVWRYLDLVGP